MAIDNYTPEQIEEILQAFFEVAGTRQYIGARYVPIFGRGRGTSVNWDDSDAYEPLSIVYWQGDTYTSRRYVPAGIAIDDQDYWVITGRYNAQVEQYRQEVLSFQDQIDGIRSEVESDYVPFPDSDHYPKYGTLGQVLTTLSDGGTKWENPVVPSDAQAEEVITQWLNDHPEATTTVEDGAITEAKLNATLKNSLFFDRFSFSGTDVNDIDTNSIYYCEGTKQNLPSANAHVVQTILPIANSTGVIVQLAYRYSDGRMYYRRYHNSAWDSWTDYAGKIESVINKEILNTNVIKATNRKIMHQYGLSEAVQIYTNKVMNSSGVLTDNANFDSYVFPLYGTHGWIVCTNSWSFYALNSDYSLKKVITRNQSNSLYWYEIESDYPYVIVPISHTALEAATSETYAIRFTSFSNTTGYMPSFNLTDKYHYEFINGNLINPPNYDFKFMNDGYINVITGKPTAGQTNGFYGYPLLVRAGTKIASMYNTASINLRCIDDTGYYFLNQTDTNRSHVFTKDTIVNLWIGVYAYVSLKQPTGIVKNKYSEYVTIIPPEIQSKNKWVGKNWYAYGTSITDIGTLEEYDNNSGEIGDGNNGNMGTYPLMIDALGGMIRHNGAIGSGGIVPSQAHGGNVKTNILACPSTADLVTLEVGPNDPWNTDEGCGEITDTGNETLMGNLYQCLDYLVNNVRGNVVLLLVQGGMYSGADKYQPNGTRKVQWLKFKQKAKEMAALFKVPVIDADSVVINYGKNSTGVTLLDSIHPNYFGGAMLGRYIWDELMKIRPYAFPLNS